MTRDPESTPAADFAIEVVDRLRAAGYEALWAGGCVRDRLLGKRPKDFDVATSATPDQVRDVFGRRRTIAVGAAFGVITVLGPRAAGQIEIATFRADADYTDGRRPDSVRFTSAEEDAKRRDFTINGLFFDPSADRVIDYVGGEQDLQQQLIRAIGDPDQRFAEDRLRMLRAVRFAASLRFQIDPATRDAIRRRAGSIGSVSPERIGAEVKRMLTEADPPRAIGLLSDCGLLEHVLPALGAADAAALDEARHRLAGCDRPTAPLALAAVLLDVADPEAIAAIARGLRWTNKEIDRAHWLVANRTALHGAESNKWSTVQPLLAADGAAELVQLLAACGGDPATLAFCHERLAWPRERRDPPPLVLGADLIAAGRRPGPDFKRLLERARAAQLDGLVTTKEDALAWLEANPPAD